MYLDIVPVMKPDIHISKVYSFPFYHVMFVPDFTNICIRFIIQAVIDHRHTSSP